MKVKRITWSTRGCGGAQDEEEQADTGACRTRARAAPCGQDKLRQILNQLLFRQKHLRVLLSTLEDSARSLDNKHQRKAIVAELTNLLSTCEPIFNNLGSKLSHFSEKHDGFAQLPLSPSCGNVSLGDCQPSSTDICMGQSKLDRLLVTTFLYCQPTPYLSMVNTGLFKYIRWNVVHLGKGQNENWSEEDNTDFFFLCFEDVPGSQAETGFNIMRRIWSIGRWVQTKPDPEEETIYDWILCEVPEGRYERLLVLGSDEPSIGRATDALCQLLHSLFSAQKLVSPQSV